MAYDMHYLADASLGDLVAAAEQTRARAHDPAERIVIVEQIRALSTYLGRVSVALVAEAREAGASWAEIGHMLGISKQAAWEKFQPHTDDPAIAAAVKAYVDREAERA